jgi:hypothetical protein
VPENFEEVACAELLMNRKSLTVAPKGGPGQLGQYTIGTPPRPCGPLLLIVAYRAIRFSYLTVDTWSYTSLHHMPDCGSRGGRGFESCRSPS